MQINEISDAEAEKSTAGLRLLKQQSNASKMKSIDYVSQNAGGPMYGLENTDSNTMHASSNENLVLSPDQNY